MSDGMTEYSVEQEISALEEGQKMDRERVLFAEAIGRLRRNPDFQKVILKGFCLTEAARYVQESGDPLLKPEQRQDALALAQASGHLLRFLHISELMARTAGRNIESAEEMLYDLRAEMGAPAAMPSGDPGFQVFGEGMDGAR